MGNVCCDNDQIAANVEEIKIRLTQKKNLRKMEESLDDGEPINPEKFIEEVRTEEEGIFKYILVEIVSLDKKYNVIRGWKSCTYHSEIFDNFMQEECVGGILETDVRPNTWFIDGNCFSVWPQGGGRINLDRQAKKITIYGYSNFFG